MIFLHERTQNGAKEDIMKAMLVTNREINGFN